MVKVTTVNPWRAALSIGHSALDLSVGRAALVGVETGDCLSIEQLNTGMMPSADSRAAAKI